MRTATAAVYVTGSTSFWLNVFTDTPQLIIAAFRQSMPVLPIFHTL
jgi:hypothetical protein